MNPSPPSAAGVQAQLQAALDAGDAMAEATARTNLACVALWRDASDAVDLFEQAQAATRRAASTRSEAILLLNAVPAFFERGDTRRALELAQRLCDITARSSLEQRVLARLYLGRIWIAGFGEHQRGTAALGEALDALDEGARRAPALVQDLVARLQPALMQAGRAAAEARDLALAQRLLAHIDPAAAESLRASSASHDQVPALADLRARRSPAFDDAVAAWRERRSVPSVDEARRMAAALLGWDDERARRDRRTAAGAGPAPPTCGGLGGVLALAEDIAAGRTTVQTALPVVRALGICDDDLAFLATLAAQRKDAPPPDVLWELVAGATTDDRLAASCARLLAGLHTRHRSHDRALAQLDAALARLNDGVDDRLRADALNARAVALLSLGRAAPALEAARRARDAALAVGRDDLARSALGNEATALLNLRRATEALPLFERLADEQRRAGDESGLKTTRFNLAATRMSLGDAVPADAFGADDADPDVAFMAAYAHAAAGDRPRAIAAFRAAFERFGGRGHDSEAGARSNFSRVLYDEGEFDAMAEQLQLAAALFERRGERSEQIDALLRLASTEVSPLPAALAAAERAVAVARETGPGPHRADALGTLGQLQLRQGRPAAAAITLAEAVDADPRPELRRALASAWIDDGRAGDALPVLEECIAAARAATGEDLVIALTAKAKALQALEQPAAAIGVLRDAREAARDLKPSANVASSLNELGQALTQASAFVEAASVLEQALGCAREARATHAQRAVLNNLGMALNESGDFAGATAAFEAARDLARRHADARGEGTALLGLANAAANEHRSDDARALYLEAAGIGQQHGAPALQAAALDSLASTFLARGEAAAAIGYQRQAAELHRELGAARDEATDRINLASSYLLLGELDDAEAALNAARALAAAHRVDALDAALDSLGAQVLARRGAWADARALHGRAIDRFESQRAVLATPAEQRRIAARQNIAYGIAAEDALRAGDARAAVEFIERARTRYMSAVLTRRGSRPRSVPEIVMRRYEEALDRVDELQGRRRLAIAADDAALAAELARATADRDALQSQIDAAREPPTAPAIDAPDFDTLVRTVPRGHAAVYLLIANQGLGVVCAGRDDAGTPWTMATIDTGFTRADLSNLVHGDAQAWRRARTPDEVPDAALGWAIVTQVADENLWQRALAHVCGTLGRCVWPAIERALQDRSTRLLLLPGAGFAALPLHAALRSDGTRAQDRYEIRYAPSLRLLAHASRGAPLSSQPSLGQAVNPTGDLPFSAVEAERVAAHLQPGACQARVGEAATPAAVLQLFATQEVVHFGGHGSFDFQQPLRSRLHCAADPRASTHLLTARQLLELERPMQCRLALLSACESGRVEAADLLDDALGLPGALMTAGCRGAVATLWRVGDLAACLQVDEAMRLWRTQGLSLPAAFARAARWLREARGSALADRLGGWPLAETPALSAARALLRADARPFADERHWAAFCVHGLPEVALA
jgi:tetratricopeptide (TPR) repeat protein